MSVPSVSHLWGWILVNDIRGWARHFHKVSRPDVSAWLRHDSSFLVENRRLRKDGGHHWPRRGVGKKPRFKNKSDTSATLRLWEPCASRWIPGVPDVRCTEESFSGPQGHNMTSRRRPTELCRSEALLRFCGVQAEGRRGRTSGLCDFYWWTLLYHDTCAAPSRPSGNCRLWPSLHLSAETETRVSFNAEPVDSGWSEKLLLIIINMNNIIIVVIF